MIARSVSAQPAGTFTSKRGYFWVRKRLVLLALLAVGVSVAKLPAQTLAPKEPHMAGYASFLHPLVTFSKGTTTTNFSPAYVVGVPMGINLWKSTHFGFSFEITPFIRAENGMSRMSNILFHPGLLVSLGHGFTFVGRAAFETNGRYGFTPVLNKTVIHGQNINYFVGMPIPIRFGNNAPASLTIGLLTGITF
ncbi:hypothetical protein HNQ92_000704 [Rhabdobacter roseus]|uniref:Uncharacterized protein n=1 Tax=Rhabdobacter roseus TaxID=1655419 RepID=A0A840TMY8_9BACT|nr:hypothetical protein [Rhabdobacter roseus]MBB5282583.1 hypothetical protein [Rhabdobacter roseus]